jgi:TetR/AcrR family transcriptional repressor of lmrAB and yxaGH operons
MTEDATTTRSRLVTTAARLFRARGYHGVGLAEILAEAQAPKGSLYHHFPDGKSDLALAAADWAGAGFLGIVDDAFGPASDWRDGATTLCFKLAKFYDISGGDGCPVTSVLFDGPSNASFTARAETIFARWIDAIAAHGVRLGIEPQAAAPQAETLLMGIQGAWVLARARRSSDVLRQLPSRLLGPTPDLHSAPARPI